MSEELFHQSVRDVRDEQTIGFVGQVIRDVRSVLLTGNNQAPQAAQVTTVTIPTPSAGVTYTVTLNGAVTATFITTTTSADDLGNGLVAAIQGAAGFFGMATPSYAGAVLSITGRWPGMAFTITATGASIGTPTTATSSASASAVKFGRGLVSDGYVDNGIDNSTKKTFVPSTSNMAAMVKTLSVTFAASEVYLIDITVRGQTYKVLVDATTNSADTATAISNAINGVLPAATVVATTSTADVVLTAEVAGQGFSVAYGVKSGTIARLALAHTTDGILTDITRCFAGVAVRRRDVEDADSYGDNPEYAANRNLEYCAGGRIVVQRDTAESISAGDDIYLETSGADAGRFFKTASASRIWLPPAFAVWDRSEKSGNSYGVQQLRIKNAA